MDGYSTIPTGATGHFESFKLKIADAKLSQLKQLVELSPIAPATWENQHVDRRFGVSRSWLIDAKKQWLESFNWYASWDSETPLAKIFPGGKKRKLSTHIPSLRRRLPTTMAGSMGFILQPCSRRRKMLFLLLSSMAGLVKYPTKKHEHTLIRF